MVWAPTLASLLRSLLAARVVLALSLLGFESFFKLLFFPFALSGQRRVAIVGGSVEPFHEVAETCVRLFVRLLVNVDEDRHDLLMSGLIGRPVGCCFSTVEFREDGEWRCCCTAARAALILIERRLSFSSPIFERGHV